MILLFNFNRSFLLCQVGCEILNSALIPVLTVQTQLNLYKRKCSGLSRWASTRKDPEIEIDEWNSAVVKVRIPDSWPNIIITLTLIIVIIIISWPLPELQGSKIMQKSSWLFLKKYFLISSAYLTR